MIALEPRYTNNETGTKDGQASGSIFLVLLAAIMLMANGCREPYRIVRIAKKASISNQWTRLAVNTPLKWTEVVEEVHFRVDPPHHIGVQLNPVLSDGTHCVIEVALIDNRGQSYPSDHHAWLGGNMFYDMEAAHLATE
jgi:hypothetical protein